MNDSANDSSEKQIAESKPDTLSNSMAWYVENLWSGPSTAVNPEPPGGKPASDNGNRLTDAEKAQLKEHLEALRWHEGPVKSGSLRRLMKDLFPQPAAESKAKIPAGGSVAPLAIDDNGSADRAMRSATEAAAAADDILTRGNGNIGGGIKALIEFHRNYPFNQGLPGGHGNAINNQPPVRQAAESCPVPRRKP